MYVLIADFFKEDILGGGEIVNDEIFSTLSDRAGAPTVKIHSHLVTLPFIESHTGLNFIVGNFLNLSPASQRRLRRERYVIYEHDHKYLKTRDPSVFPNLLAPKEQLTNMAFYRDALAVVCQSKMHADVLAKNTHLRNIVNAGGNPWPEDHLQTIEEHLDVSKKGLCGIMDSPNQVKNTEGAIQFCKQQGYEYKLIPPGAHDTFIKELSECDSFAFFPVVMETMSRVIVEAKMLGCKIYTNGLIGATSEDWFSLKGQDLVDHTRGKRSEIATLFENIFSPTNSSPYQDITVILNAYRRPYNLDAQIKAIREQTKPPKQIWVWVNDHEDLDGFDFSQLDADKVFRNDHNWKFYGRFAAALLAETEHVAIFDDDTIPGSRWLENCLSTMETHEGILGSAGVILEGETYNPHQRCGWPTHNEETTQVDLVGHAWFFKREWLRYLWTEPPITWDNGEDMQFSYAAQKYGNINTYCPPHPADDKELHGSILGNELGIDDKATSTNSSLSHQAFFSERDYCVSSAVARGWVLVKDQEK
tara:strand:+ start:2426 stop:4021 length:1596 start_codon:yes stop_codon:yes gene_type:complete